MAQIKWLRSGYLLTHYIGFIQTIETCSSIRDLLQLKCDVKVKHDKLEQRESTESGKGMRRNGNSQQMNKVWILTSG